MGTGPYRPGLRHAGHDRPAHTFYSNVSIGVKGVAQGDLSRWELGRVTPGVETLLRIAAAGGVGLDYFDPRAGAVRYQNNHEMLVAAFWMETAAKSLRKLAGHDLEGGEARDVRSLEEEVEADLEAGRRLERELRGDDLGDAKPSA